MKHGYYSHIAPFPQNCVWNTCCPALARSAGLFRQASLLRDGLVAHRDDVGLHCRVGRVGSVAGHHEALICTHG